jgi:hypothetical protein
MARQTLQSGGGGRCVILAAYREIGKSVGRKDAGMANELDEQLTPEELEEQEEEIEDLAAALKQAKRKPRYFAIVANGNEILSLMMQKKPFRPAAVKQERREEGGKQTYQGVCQGTSGTILAFKFDSGTPKFKPGRLRKYIAETTGVMVKPEFQTQPNVKP